MRSLGVRGWASVGLTLSISVGGCNLIVGITDLGPNEVLADGGDEKPPESEGGPSNDAGADTTPPPSDGGNPECSKLAPSFHPTPEAGPLCPFQQAPDGSTFSGDCNPIGEHCCFYSVQSKLPSTCNAANMDCTVSSGTVDFQCEETADCVGANQVCCLNGTMQKDSTCGTYFGKSVSGTTCRIGSCMIGEVQICDNAQSTCPNSQTCQPFKTKSIEMGGCTN